MYVVHVAKALRRRAVRLRGGNRLAEDNRKASVKYCCVINPATFDSKGYVMMMCKIKNVLSHTDVCNMYYEFIKLLTF